MFFRTRPVMRLSESELSFGMNDLHAFKFQSYLSSLQPWALYLGTGGHFFLTSTESKKCTSCFLAGVAVSPDGGLQQSSSVADSVQYAFADGEVKKVPGSYIEFAERLVLPVFSSLSDEQVSLPFRNI